MKPACALLTTLLLSSAGAWAAPPACTCKDLPAMVKEIIEQEWLGKKFREWSEYMPVKLTTPGRIQAQAQTEFTAHFYPPPKDGAPATGTQDGGHAALGTNYDSEDCGIGEFQYNKKGRPVNKTGQEVVQLGDDGKPPAGKTPPKDNEHYLKPLTDERYMKSRKECEALARYPWVHEQHHQQTCQRLKAEGRTQAWDSMSFFARNDAEAYKAGVDYLRQQTRQLASRCGWEGSTGENAVPTPERAQQLAQKGAKISRQRAGGKAVSASSKRNAKIIMGVSVENAPMQELLARWDAECVDDAEAGCAALGTSIEVGLVDLLRGLARRGGVDRETLFDAAHAQSIQLKELAMRMLHNAQSAEETAFALEMTEHPSPSVREAARQMLQGSEDPRWQKMAPLWRSPGELGTSSLVPDLPPRAQVLGVDTLEGLRHLPWASSETQTVFSTREAPKAVVSRVFKGREVMTDAAEMRAAGKGLESMMMTLQQEMMRAAQTGDVAKMNELTTKFMALQQKLVPANPMAINQEEGTIGILLEKNATNGMPVRVARVRTDEASGQTLVIFQRMQAP